MSHGSMGGGAVVIFRDQCEGKEPFREGQWKQAISHLAQEAWVSWAQNSAL